MSSSATDGHPGTPRREQQPPSCITAPSVRRLTSQCCASRMPRLFAYSSALRMSSGSCTPVPSSVKICTPAAASSAIGASTSPARPIVMQPLGNTSHRPACSPRRRTICTTATLSCGGSVFGIATTAVKPPSAAAREPVSTVSASSRPGSRRCTCRSTKPGLTMQPLASSTRSPVSDGPTSVMTPPSIRTSPTCSPRWSRIVPPLMTTDVLFTSVMTPPLPIPNHYREDRIKLPCVR